MLLFVFKRILVRFFFLSTVYFLGIVYILGFGQLESLGLFLCMVLGFISVSLVRNYIWRFAIKKRSLQLKKEIIFDFILFFILLQVFLVLIAPLSSIVPKRVLEYMYLVKFEEKNRCNINSQIEATKFLWRNSINYDVINIVEGGLNHNLWLLEKWGFIDYGYARVGMTFGSTIYLYDISECPSGDIIFHEMTHVWQMQKDRHHLFGFGTIPVWVRYQYKQITDSDVLYDYGGEIGLSLARQKAETFSDFGIEQQAMIVEDLYLARMGHKVSSSGEKFTLKYVELLIHYTSFDK